MLLKHIKVYIFYRNPISNVCVILYLSTKIIWSLLLLFWYSEKLVYINQYVSNETEFLWPLIFFFSIYKLMPVTFYYVNKCTFVVAPGPFTFVFHLRFKMKFNTRVYINPQLFLKPKKFIHIYIFLDLHFFSFFFCEFYFSLLLVIKVI